ncbi:MAG: hypothetical protein AAB492_00150 [Patescibacteria group bacterium]
MKRSTTKPKGATSYKETAFGILPRTKLLPLELEGTKRGMEYIYKLVKTNNHVHITPELICKLHHVSFGWIFSYIFLYWCINTPVHSVPLVENAALRRYNT